LVGLNYRETQVQKLYIIKYIGQINKDISVHIC
jgi:hypothetical protein